MTRAEEKALEIFPVKKVPFYGLACNACSERDANLDKRALFCMGYEQAEKDIGWISVKERLPGPSDCVVACVEVDGICTCLTLATYNEETKEWHTDNWIDGEQEVYYPDYWLPIPTKVREGEKGQTKKDCALTISDLELLHTFLYAVKNNKQGCFTFTRLSDEQYEEVLRRFNEARNDRQRKDSRRD